MSVTRQDLIELGTKIAAANLAADRAALRRGETLETDRPVAWMTGVASIEDDIRGEWIDEDEETIAAALARADEVVKIVLRYYASQKGK